MSLNKKPFLDYDTISNTNPTRVDKIYFPQADDSITLLGPPSLKDEIKLISITFMTNANFFFDTFPIYKKSI